MVQPHIEQRVEGGPRFGFLEIGKSFVRRVMDMEAYGGDERDFVKSNLCGFSF